MFSLQRETSDSTRTVLITLCFVVAALVFSGYSRDVVSLDSVFIRAEQVPSSRASSRSFSHRTRRFAMSFIDSGRKGSSDNVPIKEDIVAS